MSLGEKLFLKSMTTAASSPIVGKRDNVEAPSLAPEGEDPSPGAEPEDQCDHAPGPLSREQAQYGQESEHPALLRHVPFHQQASGDEHREHADDCPEADAAVVAHQDG